MSIKHYCCIPNINIIFANTNVFTNGDSLGELETTVNQQLENTYLFLVKL